MILTIVLAAALIILTTLNLGFGGPVGLVCVVLLLGGCARNVSLYWQDIEFTSPWRFMRRKSRQGTQD